MMEWEHAAAGVTKHRGCAAACYGSQQGLSDCTCACEGENHGKAANFPDPGRMTKPDGRRRLVAEAIGLKPVAALSPGYAKGREEAEEKVEAAREHLRSMGVEGRDLRAAEPWNDGSAATFAYTRVDEDGNNYVEIRQLDRDWGIRYSRAGVLYLEGVDPDTGKRVSYNANNVGGSAQEQQKAWNAKRGELATHARDDRSAPAPDPARPPVTAAASAGRLDDTELRRCRQRTNRIRGEMPAADISQTPDPSLNRSDAEGFRSTIRLVSESPSAMRTIRVHGGGRIVGYATPKSDRKAAGLPLMVTTDRDGQTTLRMVTGAGPNGVRRVPEKWNVLTRNGLPMRLNDVSR